MRGSILIRDKLLAYLFMITAVPIAGELKFYPFPGEDLRVSLGTPVFFFILLWSRKIHPVIAGLLTGIAVVCFRLFLYWFQVDTFPFPNGFWLHFPVFFYYFVYASLFYLFKINRLYESPFLIGLYGILIEIIASVVEISFRSYAEHVEITAASLAVIGGVAIIRSFFVLGFFNILILRETRLAEEQQRQRNEQILLLISNLYVEMFQLKKSTRNAEELTSECYLLYRNLKNWDKQENAQTALKIAGDLHEIKKDNQRIYAGLAKLMLKENLDDFMNVDEIISIIVRSNKNYGELLGKTVDYKTSIIGHHPPYHTFILFSLINNLVSNAVEAIEKIGQISLLIETAGEKLKIIITDNGCGISSKNIPLIFEPGFTTKFDQDGIASNGIGLSYIKNMIEGLDGEIRLIDSVQHERTTFEILLPSAKLTDME
jgi:two-component system sensor histidine kinase YcbA